VVNRPNGAERAKHELIPRTLKRLQVGEVADLLALADANVLHPDRVIAGGRVQLGCFLARGLEARRCRAG
jgi:hypothetical protein